MPNLPGQLTGKHYVRVIRPAFHDAHHWLPSMRDRAELRRQSLKLRFWGQDGAIDTDGLVVDLNSSWIRAARALDIGELRIDDVIGGHNNLRVITWHPKQDIRASWSKEFGPVSHIWILAVMQKKRDEFTRSDLSNFKARRLTALERFYLNGYS
jgi:hypothetical protein